MKKIQISFLILGMLFSSISIGFADSVSSTPSPVLNPFACIMTKWQIYYHGMMPLDLLNSFMANPVLACSTNGGDPSKRYPWCDTDDIVLDNGQVWAACNVGAPVAYSGTVVNGANVPLATTDQIGRFFQWGEMYGWDSEGTSSGDNIAYPLNSKFPPEDAFYSTVTDTAVGGSDRWWVTGSMQGPCATGYHVPNESDWTETLYYADDNYLDISSVLGLPLSGTRLDTLRSYSTLGRYWTSSMYPESDLNAGNAIVMSLTPIEFTGMSKDNALPIRCIKDGTTKATELNSAPDQTGSSLNPATSVTPVMNPSTGTTDEDIISSLLRGL